MKIDQEAFAAPSGAEVALLESVLADLIRDMLTFTEDDED
jgi:hypothetical protein